MTFDSDLENLFIVGSVAPGRRLCHNNGKLCIDEYGMLSGPVRRMRSEGRDRTIVSIRHLLQSASERVAMMSDSRLLSHTQNTPEESAFKQRLCMLKRGLQQCLRGLDGLKATYAADASVQAALDLTQQTCHGLLTHLERIVSDEHA